MEENPINSRTVYCVILYVKSLNLLLEAEFIQTSKHLVPSSTRKQNNEKIWLWIPLNHPSFMEVYTNPNSPGRHSEKEELPTFIYDITLFFAANTIECISPKVASFVLLLYATSNKCIDHKNLSIPQYFAINWSRKLRRGCEDLACGKLWLWEVN